MIRRRACARVLGAGALAFAALAFADAPRVAEMIGDDEAMARTLGARDLGSGLRLLLAPHPEGPILERIVLDLSDAVIFGRSRPKVGVVALGYAALGVLTLLYTGPEHGSPRPDERAPSGRSRRSGPAAP